MSKEKRILIGKRGSKAIHDNLFSVCHRLTGLLPEIKEFVILDNETFKDILKGGKETRKKIRDEFDGEIERLKILAFKREIELKAKGIISSFDNLVSRIGDILSDSLPIELFLLEGNSIILDEKILHPLIEEATNIYISEEKDIKLYELCNEIQPKIREVFELIQSYWNISLFEHEKNKLSLFDSSLNVNEDVIASLAGRREAEERIKQMRSK